MNRSLKLLEDLKRAERKKYLDRYSIHGNAFMAASKPNKTIEFLPAGCYKVESSMRGIYFDIHEIKTDELLKFEDPRYNQVIEEIKKFWELKDKYNELGYTHKRGILLYGPPGTGKSCLVKTIVESTVENGDIVLITTSMHALVEGLKEIREIESERKILVVLEDLDEMIRYGEHKFLELFDGDSQQDNICFLATTNYINNLPPRVLRASRLDRKIKVEGLPKEGREAYLRSKLGMDEDDDKIKEYVDATDGLTFADMKEFVVSVECLGYTPEKAIERLKNPMSESRASKILDKLGEKKEFYSKTFKYKGSKIVVVDDGDSMTGPGDMFMFHIDGEEFAHPLYKTPKDALAAAKKKVDKK